MKIYAQSVSNEMLNPLKCILDFSQQLCKSIDNRNLLQKNIESLGLVFSAAKYLQYHMRDLSDLNLLANGIFVPNYQPGYIGKALMKCVKLMQTQASHKRIEVKISS